MSGDTSLKNFYKNSFFLFLFVVFPCVLLWLFSFFFLLLQFSLSSLFEHAILPTDNLHSPFWPNIDRHRNPFFHLEKLLLFQLLLLLLFFNSLHGLFKSFFSTLNKCRNRLRLPIIMNRKNRTCLRH